MAFLKVEDYKSFINSQVLSLLIEGDEKKLLEAETLASGYVFSNLSTRYNLKAEFSRKDEGRNTTLLRWMLSLSVYFLHNTVPDADIPERVIKNYDDARREILNVAGGKAGCDLMPIVAPEGTRKTRFRWGGDKRRTHNPFG